MTRDEFWIIEQRPPSEKRMNIQVARNKIDRYMLHLGVNFHPDWLIWQPVRCPFHDDRHASASLNLHSKRFNCHACGVHGDAIDLVMEAESMTIREAVEWLSNL
jgi:hypothetical protein